MLLFLLAATLVLCEALFAATTPQNVTVDDLNGDSVTKALPSYTGSGAASWSQGNTCTGMSFAFVCSGMLRLYFVGCGATGVNVSRAFDGTWHDATGNSASPVSVQISFTGEIARSPPWPWCSFALRFSCVCLFHPRERQSSTWDHGSNLYDIRD